MDRLPVNSSSLASVGYDANAETLEVEFLRSGQVYEYYNVPQFMYDRMMEAASIAVFYNAEIKDAYACNAV